jgi:hypothetical protein
MQRYRTVALEGYDGTGRQPIAFGQYSKLYRRSCADALPSESFVRQQQFAAWAFGSTFSTAFVYNSCHFDSTVNSAMFSGPGDASPTAVFDYVRETNRESLNLGPALVRLVSTDVRLVPGKVGGVENATVAGISSWVRNQQNAGGYTDYISAITPLGRNRNQPSTTDYSDVLISYFAPLLSSNDGCTFADGLHFMVVNGRGLAEDEMCDSPATTAGSMAEWYRLTFDFTGSDYNALVRLSRDTGQVELVTLTSIGGPRYSLDLYLEGGTGDLFGFWNASNPLPTIPEPSSLALTGIVLLGLACRCFHKHQKQRGV